MHMDPGGPAELLAQVCSSHDHWEVLGIPGAVAAPGILSDENMAPDELPSSCVQRGPG